MIKIRNKLALAYWTAALIALACALGMAVFYAPVDPVAGPVQKITYLHVPVAICTFLACAVVFAANIGYVWQIGGGGGQGKVWDDLAAAAAEVGVVFCSVVVMTGMVWARQSWGTWWTWSPLLTFSAALWVLYAGYLLLHRIAWPGWSDVAGQTGGRRETACALYGVVAFLDVPLVYLSVKLLPDRHPSDVHLSGAMVGTLLVWFVPTTMICAGLIAARFRLSTRARPHSAPGRVVVRPRALKEIHS